jgi:hypothetical protein
MPIFNTSRDAEYKEGMESHLQQLKRPLSYVADNFGKYCRRQEVTRFLVRHELYKSILTVKGSVVECGVFSGSGLMTWAQLSAIMEPAAFWRRIYGFDTFEGFPQVSGKDTSTAKVCEAQIGDLKESCYEELQECVRLFDMNRFLGHIPKIFPISDYQIISESTSG